MPRARAFSRAPAPTLDTWHPEATFQGQEASGERMVEEEAVSDEKYKPIDAETPHLPTSTG